MNFTTNIYRLLIIAVSALTIASCSKENDEVIPEEEVSTISIINIEEGQLLEIDIDNQIITEVSSLTGGIINPFIVITNVETGDETTFDLIGAIPASIGAPVKTTLQATVNITEPGEYTILATFEEAQGETAEIIVSETLNVIFSEQQSK